VTRRRIMYLDILSLASASYVHEARSSSWKKVLVRAFSVCSWSSAAGVHGEDSIMGRIIGSEVAGLFRLVSSRARIIVRSKSKPYRRMMIPVDLDQNHVCVIIQTTAQQSRPNFGRH